MDTDVERIKKMILAEDNNNTEESPDAWKRVEEVSSLLKTEPVFTKDKVLTLRLLTAEDVPFYREVLNEYQCSSKQDDALFNEVYKRDITQEKRFYCVVVRNEDNAQIGYCGINDLKKDEWELALMLLKKYHRAGYGSRMARLLMERVSALTGRKEFFALVEPENRASRSFLRKIGFIPAGITPLIKGLKDEFYRGIEEKNLKYLDDWIRELAGEFQVEPRRLLSHVTKYRITIDDQEN